MTGAFPAVRSRLRPPATSAEADPSTRGRTGADRLLGALVVLGVALRLRQYLARRSLWNDEAALALNIVRRGYRDLLKPLEIDQGAPLGFLWAQRTAMNLLGNNEFALRLVPLIAGIAALVLFADLARRLLPGWAAAPAVLLFATLGPLVYYSAEAKQYSVDVAVAVLLVSATVRLLDRPVSLRRALGWGALGCASMLVSHPSVFVLAACSLVAVAVVAVQQGRRALASLTPGVGLWAAELAVLYVVSLRHLSRNPSLEAFWKEGYAPQPLEPGTALPWIGDVVAGLVPDPLELGVPLLVLILALVGTGALLVRRPPAGLLVAATCAAALCAGLIALYPLRWRLALYLVPIVLLALGASVDAAPRGRRAAAVVLRIALVAALGVVAVRPVREAVTAAMDPYTVTEVRSVLVDMAAAAEPTDAVYVHWTTAVLYDYYAPVLDLPPRSGYFSFAGAAPCSSEDPVASLRAHPRVWVVFAIPPIYDPAENAETSLSHLDRLGPRILTSTAPGNARAVLYRTGPNPSGAPPGRSPRPDACFGVAQEAR